MPGLVRYHRAFNLQAQVVMKIHDSDPATQCWMVKQLKWVLVASMSRDITCGLCAIAASRALDKLRKEKT